VHVEAPPLRILHHQVDTSRVRWISTWTSTEGFQQEDEDDQAAGVSVPQLRVAPGRRRPQHIPPLRLPLGMMPSVPGRNYEGTAYEELLA
jgi:hypothetical protein